jgi:hypothetical protein
VTAGETDVGDGMSTSLKQQRFQDYMTWLRLGSIIDDLEKGRRESSTVHKDAERMIRAAEQWRHQLYQKSVKKYINSKKFLRTEK